MKRNIKLFSSKQHGFTLIELLVVIAIIAILASMLLPALQQARKRGKYAVCINNFTNISKAYHQYCSDNLDLVMPYWNGTDSKGSTGWWAGTRPRYVGSGQLMGFMAAYLGLDLNGILGGLRYPFMPGYRHNNVCKYACPDMTLDRNIMNLKGDESQVHFLGLNSKHSTKIKLNQIRRPSRHMVITEVYHSSQVAQTKIDKIAFVHPGRVANVLYLGGNVNPIIRPKVPLSSDQSFWFPFGRGWVDTW